MSCDVMEKIFVTYISMTFNHLKTNSTKFAHYGFNIRKVIEFSDFQSLMQHPFSSISIALLQCVQLDSRQFEVCVIIFSLYMSSLITGSFESTQAVNTLIEGFSI